MLYSSDYAVFIPDQPGNCLLAAEEVLMHYLTAALGFSRDP